MDIVKRRLGRATDEELEQLQRILRAPLSSASSIAGALQDQSKSKFGRWFGKDLSYGEILKSLGEPAGSPFGPDPPKETIAALEDRVAKKEFERYRASLSPEERAQFDRKLDEVREELLRDENGFGKLGGGLLAAQLAAQASGFGVYMMASSVVGALTNAVGLTLPFAAYTGMSSLISWVIGPVGIAISAGMVAFQLFRTDLSRSKAAVAILAQIRHRTLTILSASLGDENPRRWFEQIERCTPAPTGQYKSIQLGDRELRVPVRTCPSIPTAESLRDDLKEHEKQLGALGGFGVISGLCEILGAKQPNFEPFTEALGRMHEERSANDIIATAERSVAEAERLRPEMVSGILGCFVPFAPEAASACYARAPQDSETHYASTMLMAARLAAQRNH